MKRRWPEAVLTVSITLLVAHSAAVDLPNFPSINDDYGVIGTRLELHNDDITDNEALVPIEMTHMRVRSEIAMRYARTAIICNVYNPSKRPQESNFNVLLPNSAFISGFTMSLGKETYEAFVKERKVAKQIYKNAVAEGVSAAHVATKARDSNHFIIKFNVEGRTNITFRLRYEEFLVRRNGVYNHAINLNPGSLVPKMDVVIQIKESQKITVLRVPEVRTGNEIDATEKDAQNRKAAVKRGNKGASITFVPDMKEQIRLGDIYMKRSKALSDPDYINIGFDDEDDEEEETKHEGLLGQFVVQYDVEQPEHGEILVNDGYFVHFFAPSPEILPPLSKHVVFVMDTSGSMTGTKLSQLKKAMYAILSELHPRDHYSIIEFNTKVKIHDLKQFDEQVYPSSYKNKLQYSALATTENIAAAKIIVSQFRAYGGTNIHEALNEALDLIHPSQAGSTRETTEASLLRNANLQKNDELEPMIIFLTDGEPTVGVTDISRILNDISDKNSGEKPVPIYSLAFGEDADRDFLRKLSLRSDGFMRQIYEAADAVLQLHDFYRQVSSPLLADVKFRYPRKQIKEGSVTRSKFGRIYGGSEVAVLGKVEENVNEVTPQVVALRANTDGRRRRYEMNHTVPVTREKDDHLPLERLWAYLTIKQLLDKSDAGEDGLTDNHSSPEKKALDIALQYSFVTPLTSLVVVRLNKTDITDPVDVNSVDRLEFVPFKCRGRSPIAPPRYITSYGSEGGLSVSSQDGPVLFVESNKRFIPRKTFPYWNQMDSSGPVNDVGGGSSSGGGGGDGGGGGSGGSVGSSSGSSGGNSGGSSNEGYIDLVRQITFPVGATNPPATTTPTTTTATPLETVYHLEGYEWALSLLNTTQDALVWSSDSGSQVVLKLSKDLEPPASPGGDYECWPGEVDGVLCVYLTRCLAARSYSALQYQHNSCQAGEGYLYAGVCCASSDVNK